jgi:hypothetical protein
LNRGAIDALRADWPVLTVAMQSGNAATVAKVRRERGLDWPTVIDADGDAGRVGHEANP